MLDEYLISVDGGGTKTVFCVYNLQDCSRRFILTGSTNYKTIGEETARKNLLKGFLTIQKVFSITREQIKGCVLGLAGCDSEPDYQVFANMLEPLYLDNSRIYMCNDSELAFFESGKAPGIVVICGTGSIVYGFDIAGKKCRAGGWGNNISDLGSGYWIGTQVIQKALLYCDGCYGYKKVFEKVKDYFRLKDFDQLPHAVSALEVYQIAAVAKTVVEFATEGDEYSLKIIRKAADYIAMLVNAVYGKLDFFKEEAIDIVLAGGMFNNSFFRAVMQSNLEEGCKLKNIRLSEVASCPVAGGINIAIEMFSRSI